MKDLFRSKLTRIALWALGIFIVIILLLDNIILPWYVNHGGTLSVPDVVGMPEAAAIHTLDSLGLEARRGEVRPDKDYPEGVIVAQNPMPQQIVKPHRRVYLTVSGGEQQAVVPDLKGRSMRDTKFALDRAGLKLGTVKKEVSNEFPEGTIVSQDLPAGMKIRRGAYIGVTQSAGQVMDSLVVPGVVGKTLAEAQKILTQKGFKIGNITFQPNSDLLPNTVIDQLPRMNEVAGADRPIDLFVAQTPEKKGVVHEH
ncbi:MAG TPA: PASTA domain-containing protein [Bacteroidota bacterium]|nr:PASTA domain-containing protein [Bacteroidota bacterium]